MAGRDAAKNAANKSASLLMRLIANPYLLLALAGLFWSGNHIAGRAAAGHLPPISMAGIRWLIGAALMYPFVHRYLRHDAPILAAKWKVVLPMIIGGGAIFSSVQYVALNHTIALNASIFNSFAPVVIGAAGALLFRDRFSLLQMTGIVISLVGVLSIVSRGDFDVLRSLTFNYGDVILLLNMVIWAIYCACLRLVPKVHPLSFTFALAFMTGILLIPFYFWEHAQGVWFGWDWLTFSVMGYISIFPGVLGYICWNNGQEQIGAARAAIFLHFVPIYGALLATGLLGESLRLFHVIGFVLILIGVWLAARK